MNSTNWPVYNVWVFIAQWVEHSSVNKVPSCEQRFLSCMAFSINKVIPVACLSSQVTYKEGTQILLKPLNVFQVNNCVAEWRWVPGMSRGFHLWHSQPLDRVTPPWLANPCPPVMSPHANGTRNPSH